MALMDQVDGKNAGSIIGGSTQPTTARVVGEKGGRSEIGGLRSEEGGRLYDRLSYKSAERSDFHK